MTYLQRRFESVTRRREKAIASFVEECKSAAMVPEPGALHVSGVANAIDNLRRAEAEFEAWKEAVEIATKTEV